MKTIAKIYAVNAISFLANLGAIFVYSALAGHSGYGTYSIYIAFSSFFLVFETALIKSALRAYWSSIPAAGRTAASARVAGLLNAAVLRAAIISLPFVALANFAYPYHAATGVGGSIVLVIALLEFVLSYPSTRLSIQLAIEERFLAVYVLRLGGTLLRHACGWSVLWMTGSPALAIGAILVKALIFGGFCMYWNRRHYRLDSPPTPPDRDDFSMLINVSATAFALIVIQELPGAYIDKTYGRETLGGFRMVYDIVAAVWFLATIYPTVLFSSLVRKGMDGSSQRGLLAVGAIGELIGMFHACYFLGAIVLFVIARHFYDKIAVGTDCMLSLFAGVSILGYNRFLIEVAHAHGRARETLYACVGTSGVVLACLTYGRSGQSLAEVGLAWIVGQTALLVMLKFIITKSVGRRPALWRGAAIILSSTWLVVAMGRSLSIEVLAILSLVIGFIGFIVLLVRLVAFLKSVRNDNTKIVEAGDERRRHEYSEFS